MPAILLALTLCAAAIATTAPSSTKPSGVEVGRLIRDGWAQLLAHNYSAAVALFNRAERADPRDITLLSGRGICQYEMKNYKLAHKDLDRAYGLATSAGRPSRQLVIAYAATELMNANAMRAARVIMDLSKPDVDNGKVDEELQDDLGTALAHADAQARGMELYQNALRYYMECDKLLNQQKGDGKARWGTKWIDKAEAAKKWQAYQQASANVTSADFTLRRAQANMTQANSNYGEIKGGLRLHSDAEIARYTREWQQAIRTLKAAQANASAAQTRLKQTEAPPFPDRIEHKWEEPR